MKAGKFAYVIFRKYSSEEIRSRRLAGETIVSQLKLFGWSESKHSVRLFNLQRNPQKYFIKQVALDDIDELGSQRSIQDLQLDMITLRSNRLKKDVIFMTTAEERDISDVKIQRLFSDACVLSSTIGPEDDEVELTPMLAGLANFKPRYAEALAYLGYKNAELNNLFDSVEDYDERWVGQNLTGGVAGNMNISKIIIYSLESVVKVLIDEM